MVFEILSDGRKVMGASDEELDDWMNDAFEKRLRRFGKNLFCYSPTAYPYRIPDHAQSSPHNFVSLSVTGTACSLNCEHCDGTLLTGMEPTLTPENLFKRCTDVKNRGGEGVLISGGSDSTGHVPLDRFAEAIGRVKSELDLKVVVHTGLVSPKTAELLGNAGIDAAMLDVIGDADLAERVYHLKDGPRQMERSLEILNEHGIPTVPHVLVGLDYGKLAGEIEALDMIAQNSPAAVVFIVLFPVRNTPMEHITPPTPRQVGKVMTVARLGMENTPVLLGCARPKGEHKIQSDLFAIRSGANGVALISQEGVEGARAAGLEPVFADVCCSLAYQHVATVDAE